MLSVKHLHTELNFKLNKWNVPECVPVSEVDILNDFHNYKLKKFLYINSLLSFQNQFNKLKLYLQSITETAAYPLMEKP